MELATFTKSNLYLLQEEDIQVLVQEKYFKFHTKERQTFEAI